jgi:DNA-binding transcriptional LysR family regulator
MNLRQLEAFRATIRCGSITEAAKMLHISQPSVSRLIADLQHSAGFPLFVRVGRGLTPTVEGRHFYEGVEGMFVGIDRLQDQAVQSRLGQSNPSPLSNCQRLSISSIKIALKPSLLFKRETPPPF